MIDQKNLLKEITEGVLQPFDYSSDVFSIEEGEEDSYRIDFKDSEDIGYLIGYHGKTIDSLEFIINLIYYYKTGEWKQVVLNVGDYRDKKEQFLHQSADMAIEKALYLLEPVPLSSMSAKERRIVHIYIKKREDVYSESEGDGFDRHIIIYPTSKAKEE